MNQPVRIAPSVLSADFGNLASELAVLERAGADLVHVDVMDGRFVPNITLGIPVVEAIARNTALPLDVHLMIESPADHLEAFASAGATYLTVHAEAVTHLHSALQRIRALGCKAGLALNPLTPLSYLEAALPYLDLALVMSVDPGFGGQSYLPTSTARLAAARALRDELNPGCLIEVDGGINGVTAVEAVTAGADVLVAGSAVFGGAGTVEENIGALRVPRP